METADELAAVWWRNGNAVENQSLRKWAKRVQLYHLIAIATSQRLLISPLQWPTFPMVRACHAMSLFARPLVSVCRGRGTLPVVPTAPGPNQARLPLAW